jgi:hypothetical protein
MGESTAMQEPLERLRLNATKCRELADTALTPNARDVLSGLAQDYEQKAQKLERTERERGSRPPFRWSLQ